MLKKQLSILYICLLSLCTGTICPGRVLDFHGQASAWLTVARADSLQGECGIRYTPRLVAEIPIARTHLIDAEASYTMSGMLERIRSFEDYDSDYSIDLYRLWCRFSGPQYELRGGLQKINFGSATVFRPLMWFDQVDVRDPLRITDGVYAMLFRYYFLNNTNVWLWGLYGNHEVKGWEAFATDSGSIEYGGRAQIPLFTGECGMAFHHRNVSLDDLYQDALSENRLGVDGKWDIGVGVWLEGTIVHQDKSALPEFLFQLYPQLRLEYQRYFNAGIDYTFSIGNGIYVLAEHFVSDLSDEVLGCAQERQQLSAVMLRYLLGTVDEVSAVMYYDWDHEDLYRYAKWTRTYDRWMIHVVGFWNPDRTIYSTGSLSSTLAATGVQLILVFNH
jgi:hypothetical protein